MREISQTEFNDYQKEDFIAVNEPHLACVLLLDTSSSMENKPIDNLNKALNEFKEKTSLDELAKKRVDISIIEFNSGAREIQPFTPLESLPPITLTASGSTSMGAGINLAIDKIKERVQLYAKAGTPIFRPWIFMITDGFPTDDISSARDRIKNEESKGTHGKLKFFALGVEGYHEETLKSLTMRTMALDGYDFEGIFNWLSESMVIISASRVDENPQLPQLPENARVIPTDW